MPCEYLLLTNEMLLVLLGFAQSQSSFPDQAIAKTKYAPIIALISGVTGLHSLSLHHGLNRLGYTQSSNGLLMLVVYHHVLVEAIFYLQDTATRHGMT